MRSVWPNEGGRPAIKQEQRWDGRDGVGGCSRSADMRVISGKRGREERDGGGRAGVIRQEMRPLNQTIGREREPKVSAPNRQNTGH